jgi:hypothetical protein
MEGNSGGALPVIVFMLRVESLLAFNRLGIRYKWGHPYPKGSKRKGKKGMNPESVVELARGLRLVVSTLREEDQAFRCSISEVNAREELPLAYRVISYGFEPLMCLEAQTGA